METEVCFVNWGAYIAQGLLLIILGIIAIAYPASVVGAILIFFGIIAIITGIISIAAAISYPSGTTASTISLLLGIFMLLLGAAAFLIPEFITTLLVYIIALWAFVVAIRDFTLAFTATGETWGRILFFIIAIIAVLFGVYLLIYPLISAVVLAQVFGIFAIVFGIFSLIAGIFFRNRAVCVAGGAPGTV